MSSQGGAYDQNLLDEAPVATKAQRQEGYNVDLLDDRPVRPTSTQPLQSPRTIPSDVDLESSSLTREKIVPGVAATHASRPTQSFWRTRNGKITIFVVAIIIIGAVVGGAVGGTVGKTSSNNNIASTGTQPMNSTSSSNSMSGSTASDGSITSGSFTPSATVPASATSAISQIPVSGSTAGSQSLPTGADSGTHD